MFSGYCHIASVALEADITNPNKAPLPYLLSPLSLLLQSKPFEHDF